MFREGNLIIKLSRVAQILEKIKHFDEIDVRSTNASIDLKYSVKAFIRKMQLKKTNFEKNWHVFTYKFVRS